MQSPVGIGEVPNNIPKPVYIGELQRDSLSNFYYPAHTGSSKRLWIGDAHNLIARILIRFAVDDSVIIAESDSARVIFTTYGGVPNKSVAFAVFPITANWNESSVSWTESSTDTEWSKPGGDYDNLDTIAHIVMNDSVMDFRLLPSRFSLLDTSHIVNNGMIFVYELGDTLLSVYSKESVYHSIKIRLYYGDSTKDYSPTDDAFITNSTYNQGNDEVVLSEGYPERALFYFDIDTVPRNVTINKAFLSFGYDTINSYLDSMTVYLLSVDSIWEGSETKTSEVASATFTIYKGDTASVVDITSLVQYWVNGGENFGFLLKPKSESSSCSRLVLDVDKKPTLSVYYTPPP